MVTARNHDFPLPLDTSPMEARTAEILPEQGGIDLSHRDTEERW